MVRFKPVPEPCDLARVRQIHDAVPADPEATGDCCARLCSAGPLTDRAAARDWLPFLQALELVSRSEAGYARLDWRDRHAVAGSFEANVLGVRELLGVIDTAGPITAEQLSTAEPIRETTPSRHTEQGDDAAIRAVQLRVERLLGWSEQLGLLRHQEAGYSLVGRETNP